MNGSNALIIPPNKARDMEPEQKRGPGRPPMPEATVINLRIPKDLLERLARYIDREASFGRRDINRASIMRMLIEEFLEREGY